MLRLNRVSYNFGAHWTLQDISFSLDKGDFLFLIGHSGAGKTTLLNLLHAALPLKRGDAKVAGFELKRLSAGQVPLLRRQVSVVFQDFKILPDRSVFDNVAVALEVRGMVPRVIGRRVRAVLRSLDLEHKSAVPCRELSGGEQQRVAICRAIVVNPQVLLADEPTGNLDWDLSKKIMSLLGQFHAFGTTIIMATHNLALMEMQPDAKIIRLDGGRIVDANWPGAQMSGRAGSYEDLLARQDYPPDA